MKKSHTAMWNFVMNCFIKKLKENQRIHVSTNQERKVQNSWNTCNMLFMGLNILENHPNHVQPALK